MTSIVLQRIGRFRIRVLVARFQAQLLVPFSVSPKGRNTKHRCVNIIDDSTVFFKEPFASSSTGNRMSENVRRGLKNIVSSVDHALLEDQYEFIPSDKKPTSWQDRMVQRYHDGLYKEFALADVSRPGKLGLRWRTKQEVIQGRGEKTCGNKKCKFSRDLITLEVPFSYTEGGVPKKELVKLRLCSQCKPLVESKGSQTGGPRSSAPSRITRERRAQDDDSPEHTTPISGSHQNIASDDDSSKYSHRSKKRKRYKTESEIKTSDDSSSGRRRRRTKISKKMKKRSHRMRKEC